MKNWACNAPGVSGSRKSYTMGCTAVESEGARELSPAIPRRQRSAGLLPSSPRALEASSASACYGGAYMQGGRAARLLAMACALGWPLASACDEKAAPLGQGNHVGP